MHLQFRTKALEQSYRIIFHFAELFVAGSFLMLFLSAYLTFEDYSFQTRYEFYQKGITYLWLLGIVAFAILFLGRFKLRQSSDSDLLPDKKEIRNFAVLILIFVLIDLLRSINIPVNLFNFAAFLWTVYMLYSLALNYTFNQRRPAWQHPTSAGATVQTTAALGAIAGLWLYSGTALEGVFSWIIVAVLALESLIIWSRFRFLSTASALTRQTAELMLGRHLTMFGIRFIFGIIMPLVYLLWVLLVRRLPANPVILMVLVGEITGRILFFITALPGDSTAGKNLDQEPVQTIQQEENNNAN